MIISTHEELVNKLDELETSITELHLLVTGATTEKEAKTLLTDNIDDVEEVVEELKMLAGDQTDGL